MYKFILSISLTSLTALALAGCTPGEWSAGTVALDLGESVPWAGVTDGSYVIEGSGDDTGPSVSCTSRPDNSEGGEFNLRAEAEGLDAGAAEGLTAITLHVRQMAFAGGGEYSFWHGSDYGFIDLSLTTADGDVWTVPYHDPDGNTCTLTIAEESQSGRADCSGLPLESTDYVPGMDDQPEARIDLGFEWSCE